jgi:hypothetical protein
MIYRIKNWSDNFEGAKSKTYKNKTSCQMPTKHGLGYKKIIRSKNGAALFGAWCALIQVLSRHKNPRQGYCTDTGGTLQDGGIPYTSADLEMLTDIPAEYFEEMFKICLSQSVGWVEVIDEEIPQGYHKDTIGPPDSDSDSDLNLDSDVDPCSNHIHAKMIKEVLTCRPEFVKVKPEALLRAIHDAGKNPRLMENHAEFLADMSNAIKPPNIPPKLYASYLQSDGIYGRKQRTTGRRSTI